MPVPPNWQGLLSLLLLITATFTACDDETPQPSVVSEPQTPREASAQQSSRQSASSSNVGVSDEVDAESAGPGTAHTLDAQLTESVDQSGSQAEQAAPRHQPGPIERTWQQASQSAYIPTQNATVSISGTTATFSGYIDDHSVLSLIFVSSIRAEHINTVVITSRDGLPRSARRFGLWLALNRISLEIEEACLSVCAEYVFPSGATKLIRDGAVVAWLRKGPTQNTGEEMELVEKFFATVRVSPEISSWSEPAAVDTGSGNNDATFWTISIADMARFGIANVSHEGKGEYPLDSALAGESVILLELHTGAVPQLLEPLPEQEHLLLRTRFDRGEVVVEGGIAMYIGYLTRPAVSQLLREVTHADPPVDTLVIASGGGETGLGREVGDWVYENQVTVVVEGICFSSCANYIFTAAPTKVIRESAVVGWHGSEQQNKYLSINGECLADVHSDEDNSDSSASSELAVLQRSRSVEEEVEFLDMIGVSVDALLYGHMPERCEHYVTAGVAGWTFSIDDMAVFGITNVTYEGDGEYPSSHRPGRVPLIVYALSGASLRLLGASAVGL